MIRAAVEMEPAIRSALNSGVPTVIQVRTGHAPTPRISKTHNHGSGCSWDGNAVIEASIYDQFVDHLQKEGGFTGSR